MYPRRPRSVAPKWGRVALLRDRAGLRPVNTEHEEARGHGEWI